MKLTSEFLDRLAGAAVDADLADALYAPVDTPLGRLLVVLTPQGVCRIAYPGEPDERLLADVARRIGPRVIASREATQAARDALAAYLEGEAPSLELPVDFGLAPTGFTRRVLRGVARVPKGRVTTYGALAARIGHPGAARATGTALGRNPIPILVPCHRVLPGSGGVGGYGGGSERKRFLLELEGVDTAE
ncbi:MAG: methylated-DNA--[protein]-cysteine S-methyltransferase [Actinomycetota bacterium]